MLNAGSGSGNVCSAGPCPAADLPVGGAVARRNGVIPQARRLDAQRHALERDVSELEDITQGMAEIENVYRALPYDLTQFGEPRGMEFGLYTPSTRSANELIDALDAFVRLTTASVALPAYAYPQLGIPIGRGTPCSMSSLLARVERRSAWGLEVAQLAAGPIQVGLKPKGRHVKRVTRSRVGAVATIAALCTISSFCANDSAGEPPPVTAVVHVYDRGERMVSAIVTAGESEFSARLPAGSTVTTTVHMEAGQAITLRVESTPAHSHGRTLGPP